MALMLFTANLVSTVKTTIWVSDYAILLLGERSSVTLKSSTKLVIYNSLNISREFAIEIDVEINAHITLFL